MGDHSSALIESLLHQPIEAIPAELNALEPWIAAERAAVEHERVSDNYWKYVSGPCSWESCAQPEAFPTGSTAEPILDLISKNEPALALLDEGIRRGKLRFPLDDGDGWSGSYNAGTNLRTLVRVRALQIRAHLSNGKIDLAEQQCLQLLSVADILLSSRGMHLTLLVAAAYHNIAIAEIRNLIWQPDAGVSDLERLMERLGNGPALRDAMVAAEVSELRYAVGFIQPFVGVVGNRELVDLVFEKLYAKSPQTNGEEPILLDDRMEKVRKALHYLFAEHPALFDLDETRAILTASYQGSLDQVVQPWRRWENRRLGRFGQWLRWLRMWRDPWPIPLQFGMPYEFLGEDAESIESRKLVGFPQRSWDVSPGRLARSLAALRTRVNPFGRALAEYLYSHPGSTREVMFKLAAERAAARLLAALRVYEIRTGRLPAGLPDLVEAGVIVAQPTDPFDEGPLRYSRDSRKIWSVGPDGRDDRGKPKDAPFAKSYDLVWWIPTTSKTTTAA